MKLPWDKGYLKISFHVIFTLVMVYALITIIDGVVFIISDLSGVISNVFASIGSVISLFSPLVVAFVIAYLFDPVADFYQEKYEKFRVSFIIPFLEKHKINIFNKKNNKKERKSEKRFEGTMLTYITMIVAFSIIVVLIMNNLGISNGEFAEIINSTVSTTAMMLNNLETRLEVLGFLEFFVDYLDAFIGWLESAIVGIGNSIILFATSAGTALLNLIISLVVAFYFMNNKAKLKCQIRGLMDTFLPKRYNLLITHIFEDLHAVFSGYIRGLILDGIILGTLVGIGLSLIGVDLAILIGVLTAIFNLIPFFGGIIAFILSVSFELLIGTPLRALYAAIVIIVIQQIDTIFIVPRVVGKKVHLSPPAVMLSLSIAASLFGLIGMLLIVPICATIKIFVGRFILRFREKRLNINNNKSL